MVTFLVLSDLVILVVGILQIILFFKIWGMTNDVRALKKKFTLSPASLSTSEILKESYKGNPELPNFLFDAVYKDMEAVWNDRVTHYDPYSECWVLDNEAGYDETDQRDKGSLQRALRAREHSFPGGVRCDFERGGLWKGFR